MKVQTQPADQKHEQQIVIDAKGTYGGQPINGHFVGGTVLALRNNAKPYPVDLTAQSGDTQVHLVGTIDHPEQLSGADLQLELQGQDLADLYKLFHLPLAPSPPYSLRGHLDYDNSGKKSASRTSPARVGESDLEGSFTVNRVGQRPEVTADLSSHNVRMADLGGFIGAPPGREEAPTEGPKQRAQHAEQNAKPSLLPDTPIDLGKLRSTDYKVHYRGEHIVTDWAPLDHLDANLDDPEWRHPARAARFRRRQRHHPQHDRARRPRQSDPRQGRYRFPPYRFSACPAKRAIRSRASA